MVFWSKGYEGTSLEDLTRAMGINRPSLYAAFGNKESLFRKALERYVEQWAGRARRALDLPTAREGVEVLLSEAADAQGHDRPRGCLLVQGALCCGDEVQPIRRELAARRFAMEVMLRERFERARAAGERLPGEPDALARYVSTVLFGMAVQAAGGAGREDLLPVVDLALRAWSR